LKFNARLDRCLVSVDGGVRHLVLEVTAPEIVRRKGAERPPLDLALVIDASSSMSGAPLEAAKQAAAGVVEALGPRDRITVTSFADDVIRHVDARSTDGDGRARALQEIAALTTRGCTDLAAGWHDGVRALLDSRRPDAQRRVVLLSDGHANRGETAPAALARHALAAVADGVTTTAVGIGHGYSAVQLAALCEHGGGNLHHAARAEEILEVVAGELGEILDTAVEAVTVRLEVPQWLEPETLGPFPLERIWVEEAMTVHLGSMLSGATRRVIVRLTCDDSVPGDRLRLTATPCWRTPGRAEERRGRKRVLTLEYVKPEIADAEPVDAELCLEIAQAWQRDLLRRATLMVESGDQTGARALLDAALPGFRGFVRDLPDGPEQERAVMRFRRRLDRRMSPRLVKEVNCLLVKEAAGVRDLRTERAFRMEDLDRWE